MGARSSRSPYLKRVHQRAGDVVIAHRGARPVIGRRIGDRLHRQQAGAGIVGEGNAKPRAIRRLDQRQLRPAGGAQPDAVAERLAAGRAQRRQRDVERDAQRGAQAAAHCARRDGAVLAFAVACRDSSFMLQGCTRRTVRQRRRPIFDRRLLRLRQRRARALGPATFLLDRVAGELGERLSAVLRQFERAVDLGTPADAVRRVLAASGKVRARLIPPHARGRCRRGGLAVRRRLARSRGLGAGAAVRQRPAGHAGPDPPRAQAGRLVSRGADRRRHARPNCAKPSRRPRARSKAASRPASRRLPICANSARCCSAPALRCRR